MYFLRTKRNEGGGMYDSVFMVLKQKDCPTINFLESVPQHLRDISIITNRFGECITGYLDNLRFKITHRAVKLCGGSLNRYYKGSNLYSFSPRQAGRVIEKIGNVLQLPFHLAEVTKIDFGMNLRMDYPSELYLPYLYESRHYKRLEQSNGLYFRNPSKQLVFYNKITEQTEKGKVIPLEFENLNLLRYELQLNKKLTEVLRMSQIKASELRNENLYKKIIEIWRGEYQKIKKNKYITPRLRPTGSKVALRDNLALIGLKSIGGVPMGMNMIAQWQGKGIINKKQAYEQRKWLREVMGENPFTKDMSLITELDSKIKDQFLISKYIK